MLTVYNCVVNQHDMRLVLLAAVVCVLSSFTTIRLLQHSKGLKTHQRRFWIAVAAVSGGFGIWATHFIAMLAFSPSVPNGYNAVLTIVSMFAAIILTGAGLALAIRRSGADSALFGGGLIGGGIATMHYIGMAAFEIQGRMSWDAALVVASIALGVIIGAPALHTAVRKKGTTTTLLATALLTAAICSHHFTAMGAVSIIPDPSVAVPDSAIDPATMALVVAGVSLLIVFLTAMGLWLDLRDRRRAEQESSRMRTLVNAAVEGLLITDGEAVITANLSLQKLAGYSRTQLRQTPVKDLFPMIAIRPQVGEETEFTEADLITCDGRAVPVELVMRSVEYAGDVCTAIAVRDLSDRKKAAADIYHLAHHDVLTGLPNRRSFNNRLEQEIASFDRSGGRCIAVLCLDLDRFKEVNDLFGHAAGDAMLQKVAKCAGSVIQDNQMIARLGGDEFAIIATGLENPIDASRIAQQILDGLQSSNENSKSDGLVSTSIGIAIYPNDAETMETLVGHADTALYRAKAEGRSIYRFYETAMGTAAKERRMIEHELRHAIGRNELRLVYQPQRYLKTGQIIGFEALLRWRNKERGDISPALFIPIAEESRLILQIGEWVLREACRSAVSWRNQVTVAINVSAVQLHDPNFASSVHAILVETGLPASRLELEITETALVKDMNRALLTLRRLKALGILIAMDDFGTGYSSLSNLRAFPFDKIKIDGSFVKSIHENEQSATIVRAVLGLGRGLGLPVLAEGIESSAELDFLSDELCLVGQGYYLGRPDHISKFENDIAHDGADKQARRRGLVAI